MGLSITLCEALPGLHVIHGFDRLLSYFYYYRTSRFLWSLSGWNHLLTDTTPQLFLAQVDTCALRSIFRQLNGSCWNGAFFNNELPTRRIIYVVRIYSKQISPAMFTLHYSPCIPYSTPSLNLPCLAYSKIPPISKFTCPGVANGKLTQHFELSCHISTYCKYLRRSMELYSYGVFQIYVPLHMLEDAT